MNDNEARAIQDVATVLAEIRDNCFPSTDDFAGPQERRRYALLQAAATVDAFAESDSPWTVEEAVTRAEKLLAEIEKREKEGQS